MTVMMGIDPGPHTGIAVNINGNYHTATIMVDTELWDMLSQYRPEKVAYENFFTGGRIDRNMIRTMELVGSIRGVCHVLGIPAYLQQPQQRRPFILDARKLLIGQPGRMTHDEDALAHLLLLEYRIREGKL